MLRPTLRSPSNGWHLPNTSVPKPAGFNKRPRPPRRIDHPITHRVPVGSTQNKVRISRCVSQKTSGETWKVGTGLPAVVATISRTRSNPIFWKLRHCLPTRKSWCKIRLRYWRPSNRFKTSAMRTLSCFRSFPCSRSRSSSAWSRFNGARKVLA